MKTDTLGVVLPWISLDADSFMSTYVVGDLHGQVQILRELLKKIHFQPGKDHLIAVGDVIDRGQDTGELLEFLYHGAESGWFSAVKGNHEEVLLSYLLSPKNHPLCIDPEFGGEKTLQALSKIANKRKITDWIESWPLVLEKGPHIIVHGGLPSIQGSKMGDSELCDQRLDPHTGYHACLWFRPPKLFPSYDGRTVVSGHTIVSRVEQNENWVMIDTGCYRTGRLSAYRLEDRAIFECQGIPR